MSKGMSEHRYPTRSLIEDYARGAAGLVFLAIALVPMHWALHLIFGLVAALLLAFGVRTILRGRSRILVDDDAITVEGPRARRIAWPALAGLKLRYFSTRRDRKRGWMELTLTGPGATLTIESQIEGFETIVRRAARAAAESGLAVDPSTEGNLAALDIPVPRGAELGRMVPG
ncbi:hypothetical protein GCM10011611_43050 [Aliidongia dinghuensis]|uniref:PH domain-containing protein n=1 Tax=Aliidongia dinghuensis TaxID=1867774 RepID=A0A8J3E3Q1_9PROT|nr:hypothetical protein [Aliidongia dinghuensis]GGF32262.1 hypothetical protein GCM10011611_43050 [Aliidongia dinghuensis]